MWKWNDLTKRLERPEVFTVRCRSAEDGAALIAGVTTGVLVEGAKSLALRERTGLPVPLIAGRPLNAFLKAKLEEERHILAFAAMMGRRAGLGSYWLLKDLAYAPDHFCIDDADAVRACRALMFAPEIQSEEEGGNG